jgi:hypothetical protein
MVVKPDAAMLKKVGIADNVEIVVAVVVVVVVVVVVLVSVLVTARSAPQVDVVSF